jgi:hypothetical protein
MFSMNNPKPVSPEEPIRPEIAEWQVGQRVMVRVNLPDGDSHLYTDILGYVSAKTSEFITLDTRAGERVIPVADIAIGKLIPPPPARRRPRQE